MKQPMWYRTLAAIKSIKRTDENARAEGERDEEENRPSCLNDSTERYSPSLPSHDPSNTTSGQTTSERLPERPVS